MNVDQVRTLARGLAAAVVRELGYDPASQEGPEGADRMADLLEGTNLELAMAAPIHVLEAAMRVDENGEIVDGLVDHLLLWAVNSVRYRRSDEDLARQLAAMAVSTGAFSARAQSFAPRHVDMALDMLEAAYARHVRERADRWPVVDTCEARRQLLLFRAHCRSIY